MSLKHLIKLISRLWRGRLIQMKIPKRLSKFLLVIIPISIVIIFVLTTSGLVSLITHSFAVDSSGKLYVGKDSKIEVYRDKSLLYKITNLPRGFFFTIEVDDTILLSDGSTVYVMDLNGNILSQREDNNGETHIELLNKKIYISMNGEEYRKQSSWGRVEIVHIDKNYDIVIYRMPLLDYIVLILAWILGLSILVQSIFILIHLKNWSAPRINRL